jgi:hypothetical protein
MRIAYRLPRYALHIVVQIDEKGHGCSFNNLVKYSGIHFVQEI